MSIKVDDIKPGMCFRLKYFNGTKEPTRIHILAIIENHYVFKWWSYYKTSWKYDVESPWWIEFNIKDGFISDLKKSNRVKDE